MTDLTLTHTRLLTLTPTRPHTHMQASSGYLHPFLPCPPWTHPSVSRNCWSEHLSGQVSTTTNRQFPFCFQCLFQTFSGVFYSYCIVEAKFCALFVLHFLYYVHSGAAAEQHLRSHQMEKQVLLPGTHPSQLSTLWVQADTRTHPHTHTSTC